MLKLHFACGRLLCLAILCFGLVGCEPFANPYSAEAYKQATSLKARSLSLINRGTEPYSANAAKAEALLVDISVAYEFARGRGTDSTDEAAAQWKEILNSKGSVGDFVKQWRADGSMKDREYFVQEFREIVSRQFDEIIELETGRKVAAE